MNAQNTRWTGLRARFADLTLRTPWRRSSDGGFYDQIYGFLRPDGVVLDLGAGTGHLTLPIAGRMLEGRLKKWNTLQYDENAGTWEYNLKPYFEGAQKIQLAGGTLRTELESWHKHLQKCKGLGSLAIFVESLLETKSISR